MSQPTPPTASGRASVGLVAGGSRGLGLLVGRELGRRGLHVVLLARDEAELERGAQQLRAEGLDVTTHVADVRDHERLEQVVAQVESETGPIEAAIHVAGVIQTGPLTATGREHFEQAIDIMLWGPINLAFAVLPAMRERGRGRIGVVTSIGGEDAAAAEVVLGSVAQRMAESLREGMAALGPVKAKAGEAAQAALVTAIRECAAAGEVTLAEPEDAAA